MLDIKLIRSNPDLVKENIKKKFQEEKLPLVDEVLKLDEEFRASKGRGDELRQQRNAISKEIGKLMSQGKKEEAMQLALEFYSPMFLLYSMYDVADSKKKKQEICDQLKQHIDRFAENFQKLI